MILLFATGMVFTSCDTPADKVENAENKVISAEEDLADARQDYQIYLADIELFRKESAEKIAANNRQIAEYKSNVAGNRSEAEIENSKKVGELEKKNIDLKGSVYWKTMFLDLFYKTQEWLKVYHQRSHTESFHSSFKRKNRPLMKFNGFSKLVQLTARIIIHNLRKQNYYSRLVI